MKDRSVTDTVKWGLGIVIGLATLALGWYGFEALYAGEQKLHWSDTLYLSLQLFTMDSGALIDKADIGWQLQVARLLAPALTLYAVAATVYMIFRERLQAIFRFFLHDHVVVAGLGREGLEIAKGARDKGFKVVAVEVDESSPHLVAAQEYGIRVIVGDAANSAILKKARCHKASYLVCTIENDGRSANAVMAAHDLVTKEKPAVNRGSPLKCLVRITDMHLCSLFSHDHVFSDARDRFEVRMFSSYENMARILWDRYPLDWSNLSSNDPRQVHLIMVGFGSMGQSVMLQAIRVGHFANRNCIRLTVIDPQVAELEPRFRSRYPMLDDTCDCNFIAGEIDDPRTLRECYDLVADKRFLTTIAICIEEESQAISSTLLVSRRLRDLAVQILVGLDNENGIAVLLPLLEKDTAQRIAAFGTMLEADDIDVVLEDNLDTLAKAIHEYYLEQQLAEGRKMGEKTSLHLWNELSRFYQDSSRQQAHHMAVKARAVSLRIVDGQASGDEMSIDSDDVEILAEMEHRRWMAFMYLDGWQFDPKRDDRTKRHDCLKPWAVLTDEIRKYDRDPVKEMPEHLKKINKKLVRCAE